MSQYSTNSPFSRQGTTAIMLNCALFGAAFNHYLHTGVTFDLIFVALTAIIPSLAIIVYCIDLVLDRWVAKEGE